MQDSYVGDVGDFGKLALLRVLARGRRLGVCWYMHDGQGEPENNGRHVRYLDQEKRFRKLDPDLFDALKSSRATWSEDPSRRSVETLERLMEDLEVRVESGFYRKLCPRSRTERGAWGAEMVRSVETADLVFLDPDNGLEGRSLTPKSVSLEELRQLRAPGRSLLLYHHQTRFPGGRRAEYASLCGRLSQAGFQEVEAVRLRPFSSRFYFLLDGTEVLSKRIAEFVNKWGREAEPF